MEDLHIENIGENLLRTPVAALLAMESSGGPSAVGALMDEDWWTEHFLVRRFGLSPDEARRRQKIVGRDGTLSIETIKDKVLSYMPRVCGCCDALVADPGLLLKDAWDDGGDHPVRICASCSEDHPAFKVISTTKAQKIFGLTTRKLLKNLEWVPGRGNRRKRPHRLFRERQIRELAERDQ